MKSSAVLYSLKWLRAYHPIIVIGRNIRIKLKELNNINNLWGQVPINIIAKLYSVDMSTHIVTY